MTQGATRWVMESLPWAGRAAAAGQIDFIRLVVRRPDLLGEGFVVVDEHEGGALLLLRGADGREVVARVVPRQPVTDDLLHLVEDVVSSGREHARLVLVGCAEREADLPLLNYLKGVGAPVSVVVLAPDTIQAVLEAEQARSAARPGVDEPSLDLPADLVPLTQAHPWLLRCAGVDVADSLAALDLTVPPRTRAALAFHGIERWGDLDGVTLREIGDAPQTGAKALAAFEEFLKEAGPHVEALVDSAGGGGEGAEEGTPGNALREALDEWYCGLDERSRAVVDHRILGPSRTLGEIGRAFGVTRERIRQLSKSLEAELRGIAAQLPDAEALEGQRLRWGTWAPVDVDEQVASTGADRLVLHLAGLQVVDGVVRSREALPGLDNLPRWPEMEEVLDAEAATAVLEAAGIHGAHHDAYLRALGLEHRAGMWVLWPRSRFDRAILLLTLAGEPVSTSYLARESGSQSERSLRQRLLEDPRVQRVGAHDVGLRAWGLPEYTSVPALLAEAIARENVDGWGDLERIAAELERVHGVRPSTVRIYAGTPMFQRKGSTVRLRPEGEPWTFPQNPPGAEAVEELDGGAIAWDVAVNSEVLRGSGVPFPMAGAQVLGLTPGSRVTFHETGGERTITVAWHPASIVGPMGSTLRAVANSVGAGDGSSMRVVLDPEAGTFTVSADG